MSDILVYIIAAVVLAAFTVAAALLGRFLYARALRVSLVRLLGLREAIVAGGRGLARVIEHLLSEDEESLATFAADPDGDDRRALDDIASRMLITVDEVRAMPLPKRLWPAAEEMEKAARTIAEQAGRVGDAPSAEAALDALASIEMRSIREAVALVDTRLQPLLEAFQVYDPAVYGGGLYI